MISNVYVPYVMAKKPVEGRSMMMNEDLVTQSDRKIFYILDHVMGSQRSWSGMGKRLIPSDASGRLPGMGTAGMQAEELRIRKFMESCTFKAMISCAGGIFL